MQQMTAGGMNDHNGQGGLGAQGQGQGQIQSQGQGQGQGNGISEGAGAGGVSDENRRVLEWIAQMMNANTRESALLELSKKREQVPELALILWHSFGTAYTKLRYTAACLVLSCHTDY